MRSRILLLLAALVLGCGPAAEHSGSGQEAAGSAPGSVLQGTLQLVTLNRLQGNGGAIPCAPDSIPVLAAAADLRDRLRAAGDTALLVAVGDAVSRSYKVPQSKAGEVIDLAGSLLALDALAAAQTDIYVPSHGDLLRGFDQLLDRCKEKGLTVLLSNLAAPGHPEVRSSLLVEAGTLRIGCIGIIPSKIGDADDTTDERGVKEHPITPEYPGATLLPLRETVAQLVADLRGVQRADIVVAFSSVSQKTNGKLASIPGLDVIIGSTETNTTADRIIVDGRTALMTSLPAGREVGLTTIAIRNGNLQMVDLSPLHTLPGQIESAQARLDEYAERFGTSEPAVLARLVSAGDEQAFLNMVQLLEENRESLEVHRQWKDSYIEQRPAELLPVRADHPVAAVLDREGAVIEAALGAARLKPAALPEGRPLIPQPEDCRSCHAAQYEHWAATAHADSAASLSELERLHDVSCLRCHAAGFGDPSGWVDPRFDAPLGGVTCYQCHESYALHAGNARLVVDPQYAHADASRMKCFECHVERRSPGFDKDSALAEIACPPMRADEPPLLLARQAALDAIRARRAKGAAEPRDDYLEGRALVGLGQFEAGQALLESHAHSRPEDAELRVQIAQLLETSGNSAAAAALLADYLERHAGDPLVNQEYVKLLLAAGDVAVRDPEAALARLKLLLPEDPAESRKANLDFRVLQIDALFATNRVAEGLSLINELSREHGRDPRLQQRITHYLGR